MRLRELFQDHYWDTFEADKDLIMKHIDAVLTLSAAIAWDNQYNRSYSPVERRAAEIYHGFEYDEPGVKPSWFDGGNSLKQDAARQQARAELRAAGHVPL